MVKTKRMENYKDMLLCTGVILNTGRKTTSPISVYQKEENKVTIERKL